MQWFSIGFSIVATGGGVALFSVRDLSPVMRLTAQALLILGLIIAVPAAIGAAETVNEKLNAWGVWQKFADVRATWERNQQAQKQQISFDLSNSTGSTLEIEFSDENNYYWPGGGQVYVLRPGAAGNYSLQCRFEGQKICFGAWVLGNSGTAWGVGYKRASGCKGCCSWCGNSFSTRLVYR